MQVSSGNKGHFGRQVNRDIGSFGGIARNQTDLRNEAAPSETEDGRMTGMEGLRQEPPLMVQGFDG